MDILLWPIKRNPDIIRPNICYTYTYVYAYGPPMKWSPRELHRCVKRPPIVPSGIWSWRRHWHQKFCTDCHVWHDLSVWPDSTHRVWLDSTHLVWLDSTHIFWLDLTHYLPDSIQLMFKAFIPNSSQITVRFQWVPHWPGCIQNNPTLKSWNITQFGELICFGKNTLNFSKIREEK